ncbi:MAG TPA: GGDEF domain-containing protein [Acidiferrobacterales bacterium]|nr:GGDEF domain-containing protein [Acidiferrobacterales bacterium]
MLLVWLKRWRRIVLWPVILALLIAAFLLHYLSGTLLDFYVVFLVPSLLATWFLGYRVGVLVTIASCFGWSYSDLTLRVDVPFWANIVNSLARLVVFFLFVWAVHQIRVLMDRLEVLSRTDGLTGLANRRAFLERGQLEIIRARRNEQPLSVMFIDVDNFKLINDTFGHQGGDAILLATAGTLAHSVRATDLVARLGGDEFVIVFPDTGGVTAIRVAKKIKKSATNIPTVPKHPVSFSIGIATFKRAQTSFEAALRAADDLMYEVKLSGKNAILQRDIND